MYFQISELTNNNTQIILFPTNAVASLSRFAAAPREGHLKMAIYMMGYLKKYPKKGYYINEKDPEIIDNDYEKLVTGHDFGTQYHYFKEEIDPRFPEPVVDELKISIFCDANHGHDKVTGRSITGIIVFVGSTPILWESKKTKFGTNVYLWG